MMEFVGHCGRIFREFEICEEIQIDDLCYGCCMEEPEYPDDVEDWDDDDIGID